MSNTVTALDRDQRPPAGHMNYPGDQRGIMSQGPKGPNLLRELLWPVEATYDPDTDTTRVGFSFIAAPDAEAP